jgi:hypothetical protein
MPWLAVAKLSLTDGNFDTSPSWIRVCGVGRTTRFCAVDEMHVLETFLALT